MSALLVDRHLGTSRAGDLAVTLQVRDEQVAPQLLADAWDAVHDELDRISRAFSVSRPDSAVAQLRAGATLLVDDGVATVIDRCLEARTLTGGAFDPWALDGGFDPSGLLHGWTAEVCADVLRRYGLRRFCVDVSGDLLCRGEVWRVAVTHPDDALRSVATLEACDAAVATSRWDAVVDPRSGLRASGARQATVVGPDAVLADALATALVVDGVEGSRWFASLPEWSACLVDGDELAWWGSAVHPAG
ncbi:MAG TPA: FAD:protein FMN transferase [Candidatus Nanopelagicales bacterium]|nr:FAD:protein FMN transferase [Candidatus Nanopelagicales bacterium]